MRYSYHDFCQLEESIFFAFLKRYYHQFFMLSKELVDEPFMVKNFRKQQHDGVSVIDLHYHELPSPIEV